MSCQTCLIFRDLLHTLQPARLGRIVALHELPGIHTAMTTDITDPSSTPRAARIRFSWWPALGTLVLYSAMTATTPSRAQTLSASGQQARVQQALQAHEAGRLDEARIAFESLSREGLPLADYNLAVMQLNDEVPGASLGEALRLMTRAAEGGFVTAMLDLATLHDDNQRLPRNLAVANRWFERAAEAGSVDAQVAIATAHFLGRGTPRDPARAAHWYREAAKGGDVGAQYLIASMYEAGDGVERDLRLARYWYDVAAQNGDVAAPGKVKELDRLLGSDRVS